jgi:nitroreductase
MLDMGISMEHMVLAAHDRGYGTCWLGGQFDEDVVREALEVPDSHIIVALLPVVNPDEAPEARERKPPDKLYSWKKW